MSTLNKRNKGFTLLELMVVMGILAVLAAIIFPAVSGVKGTSVEGQAKTDADATQKGLERFNNQSIKAGIFPEETFTVPSYNFFDSNGASARTVTAAASTTTDAGKYTKIKWDAEVKVWLQDGTVAAMNFVPNFLQKQPESAGLVADENASDKEFLWLLRHEGAGAEVSRKVEVYRLKPQTEAGAAAYMRLY